MIITSENKIESTDFIELEYFDGGGMVIKAPIVTMQYCAKPTTPEETADLVNGKCPKCDSVLSGDNGMFCVRDQIWWEMPIPPATYID